MERCKVERWRFLVAYYLMHFPTYKLDEEERKKQEEEEKKRKEEEDKKKAEEKTEEPEV